jgi:hypothetical protein
MVGEKALDPQRYQDGSDWGDNEFLLGGYNRDYARTVAILPARDQIGVRQHFQFGSVHQSGWHMTMVDGSVRPISYGIEAVVHRAAGVRNDGLAADAPGL